MRKKRNKKTKRRRVWAWIFTVMILTVAGVVTAGATLIARYGNAKMDVSLLNLRCDGKPATLYAYEPERRAERVGEVHALGDAVLYRTERYVYVPYGEIPVDLIHAFVAIEDKRFYQHDGVDFLRTAKAGVSYLTGSRRSFGASTITQQLVKNLTGKDEYTLERKFTEIFKALDLEEQVSKERILESYLNVINLANGCRGVGAAAERYFGKSASELTLPECAAIAAITNNPAYYNPLRHPEHTRDRRDLILREMESQGYISSATCAEALATDLSLNPTVPASEISGGVTSWYADMVAIDVIRDLQARRGYTYEQAKGLVYGGNLSIYTAMDEELQRIVTEYYEELSHFPTGEYGRPQSAFILIDPSTGDILAVAGGVGEKSGSRVQNYATDTRRPAGSAIKPLGVYAPALQNGLIHWASLCEDEPLRSVGGNPWPHNADGRYRGHVTVREAMAHSINTVAVRILEEVGVERSFAFLHDTLQIRSLESASHVGQGDLTVSSLALGQHTAGVSVRELTAGYTVFADGQYRPAISYVKVLDENGRILLENQPAETRALSAENAYIMTRLLMSVTEDGTAKEIALTERTGIEAAGKTGTTQNNCDRWFVGYTPRLLAGVWMGYDLPIELRGIEKNPCVGIWDDLMTVCEEVYVGSATKLTFDVPSNVMPVTYCRASGLLPSFSCVEDASENRLEVGWFVRGCEPQAFCELHRPMPSPEETVGDPSVTLPESEPLPIPEWQTVQPESTPPTDRRPRWFRWHNPWARRIE